MHLAINNQHPPQKKKRTAATLLTVSTSIPILPAAWTAWRPSKAASQPRGYYTPSLQLPDVAPLA